MLTRLRRGLALGLFLALASCGVPIASYAGSWVPTAGGLGFAGPGGAAVFSWASTDSGDQTALNASGCVELSITSEVVSGTPSVGLYLVPTAATATASGTQVHVVTATFRVPAFIPVGPYFIRPAVTTAGGGGTITVRCAGYANRSSEMPVVSTSFGGLKACLESPVTVDCTLVGNVVLPAGHNIIRWRTQNFTLGAPTGGISGADRKTLWCLGGGWQGTNDAATDTATLTFDYSNIKHDAELAVIGCSINGTTDTDEPVLRLEHTTGVSGSNLVRLWFQRCHWNQLVASTHATILTTATFSFAGLWFTDSQIDMSTAAVGPFIAHLGGQGGSFGQGGRVYFSNVHFVGNTSAGIWESMGSVGGGLPLQISLSNVSLTAGGFGLANSPISALFKFGEADAVIFKLANVNWFCAGVAQNATSFVSYNFTGTAALASRTAFTGDLHFHSTAAACAVNSIFTVQGSAKGPQTVDLRVTLDGNTAWPFRAVAFAGTGATLGLRQLDLSVLGRQNLPSGSDTPSFFDRTFTDKLISEALTNGILKLNGKPIPIVNGMIGTGALNGPGLFTRTFASTASAVDTNLWTNPANIAATITRAACWTEDTTGSATANVWRGSNATPITAAVFNCGFRKTDAAATTCPTCTGGVPQTATLTSTPDDKSIICSSTTPATSFQIAPDGVGHNFVNVSAVSKTVDATTISWTPVSTVTANLSCTYDTKPAWVTATQNNTLTGGELIGFRANAGFTSIGKTRVFVEVTPAL